LRPIGILQFEDAMEDVKEGKDFRFPAEEEAILKHWDDIDAFKEQLRRTEGKPEYIFYDGPPFATGLPHYGHILAGTLKVQLQGHRRACRPDLPQAQPRRALPNPRAALPAHPPSQDIVTRYASCTGHHVTRRFGWDCHGLPVEHEIDKKLSETSTQAQKQPQPQTQTQAAAYAARRATRVPSSVAARPQRAPAAPASRLRPVASQTSSRATT
jgi:isoleucyl-tRNA synthetase